jgi:hypothetical protein
VVALARLRAVQETAAPGGSPVRSPRATIISSPSGNGRCNVKAASTSAVSHALISGKLVARPHPHRGQHRALSFEESCQAIAAAGFILFSQLCSTLEDVSYSPHDGAAATVALHS